MITLNKVSHSYNINVFKYDETYIIHFQCIGLEKVWGRIFGPKFLKPWNSVESICILLKGSCLFSLILEACVISEETMRKHHIQLRWKHDKKIYSKTEDTIEFMCQYGYRQLTPKHTFRATCREGKVVYPRCG